jgi:hypothetical protein
MTRVSDEDLERMTAICTVDVSDGRSRQLGDVIRRELLALRKVAQAAVMFVRAEPDDTLARDRLDKAIDEAGL